MLRGSRYTRLMRGGVLCAALWCVAPAHAKDEAASGGAVRHGTRFEINAAIRADETSSSYARQVYDGARASLTLKVRISAHAMEADFFGEVSRSFADFPLREGSPEQQIWREDKCHQKRGLPKVIVTAIDGTVTTGKGPVHVEARQRHLGLRLPRDEISHGSRPRLSALDSNLAMAFVLKTRLSHLLIDMRILAFDCNLTTGPVSRQQPAGTGRASR